MLHSKGASAPFPLVGPGSRLGRDEALLNRSLAFLKNGAFGDAYLEAEIASRRQLRSSLPAQLRAIVTEQCMPALVPRAWFLAWLRDPLNPALQDALLQAWLRNGAQASVSALGQCFLPSRCQAGTHASLVDLLLSVDPRPIGACWKADNAIEGMVWLPAKMSAASQRSYVAIVVHSDGTQYEVTVPADGRRFRLPCVKACGAYSIAFAATENGNAGQIVNGSPLVFGGTQSALAAGSPLFGATKATKRAKPITTPLTVIVPVYRNRAMVVSCLQSLLSSLPLNKVPAKVTVVNDASPEPELVAWLHELAATGTITLLNNPYNLGFIETCNRALRLHGSGDVLLLNADTLVHGNWIDRMHQALHRAPDIASVTPWSNNGEITSFPRIAKSSPPPTVQQLAAINDIAQHLHQAGHTCDVEIPSSCGFAMLVRGEALQRVGLLDGEGLTRGYSEEVDWCLRASAAGYRHMAATSVFVAHAGTASFGYEKHLRVAQNRAVIAARYPHYYGQYHQFIRQDPLGTARQALSHALLDAAIQWPPANPGPKSLSSLPGATSLSQGLPSACHRIAVWNHQVGTTMSVKVLALARLIAGLVAVKRPMRLLVFGVVTDAHWHTGVVDALPAADPSQEGALHSDIDIIALSGSSVVLSEQWLLLPAPLACVVVDDTFDPRAWLTTWARANQLMKRPAATRRVSVSQRQYAGSPSAERTPCQSR